MLKIYIDTGGTFTDCIATHPNGRPIRRKVLSNSAIRGTATVTDDPKTLTILLEHDYCDQFFKGYQFLIHENPDQLFTIIASDGKKSAVTLNSDIGIPTGENIQFEIQSPEEAPVFAIRMITNRGLHDKLPPLQLRLSTTKGTNALLERRGGETLFLITEGFKDLLNIKNQQRPDLFSLNIKKPLPFYSHIVEVPERLEADGSIIKKPDLKALEERIKPFLNDVEAAGICLMHSYLNPEHELQVEKLLKNLGVPYVSRSSRLSAAIKIVPRAVTTDVNAYLIPPMMHYLNRITETLGQSSLRIMSSAGSLVEADSYSPKDGLFSGPAGGVIGAVAVAKRESARNLQGFYLNNRDSHKSANCPERNSGRLNEGGYFDKIISFDMGGTSTDVSRFDGAIETIFEHTVGDATLAAPAIDIETVAAGGGSICGFDGKSLTVGPESAGANPGPACYGRGGPLTITDVNLLSGRLYPSNFQITIHTKASETALLKLMKKINKNGKNRLSRHEILSGFLDITNERMAQAIRKISIQKGFDPSDYALVAFGGAGGQHALAVAKKLNIDTVLVPSDAGLLSAYGLQQARLEQIASKQVLKKLIDVQPELPKLFHDLSEEAITELKKQGVSENRIELSRKQIHLRLAGQDSSLELNWVEPENIKSRFKDHYQKQYGHWIENREIEVEMIRVTASEKQSNNHAKTTVDESHKNKISEPEPVQNKYSAFSIFDRETIPRGHSLKGPALVMDPYSTTVIEPGWEGKLLDEGTWLIRNKTGSKNQAEPHDKPEAVQLQLYTNRFRSVAEQMGEMLRRTSISVNIKERLDFSCALLDRDGYLVVNAPHIPVHLGAMGTCVRTLIHHFNKNFEEGDVLITNHPAYGGSHLPDLTVVTPVFHEGKQIGFTANRAHHAEIGGSRPGSMPPDANTLAEEGIVIPPMYLAKKGDFCWQKIREILTQDPWPSRAVEENMADLQAAVAANHRGAKELQKLAALHGTAEVEIYMQKLKTYSAERMKHCLKKLNDGTYRAEEKLDDGSLLKVSCTVQDEKMSIDFNGSSGVHPGNLNANPSIVHSVIIYWLRLLVGEHLPLNDGLLDPISIHIPKGILNPDFTDDPATSPAVVGGNIETSQRLTDTLLKAFEMASCSYGTMNNVLFGNEHFGYYETVAGGTGAGNGFNGAHAVHQHMTNTRAADPEILEHRYPVRLDRYEIRKNSGGKGKWTGGDGMIRELTFKEVVTLSVLTQHRIVEPYGLKGGNPGKTGQQWIERINGKSEMLNWRDGAELNPGDKFILHTPGGGGFGKP